MWPGRVECIKDTEARDRELCQAVLKQLRRAGVRARPSGLAVERGERASTKEISKAKLMWLSEILNPSR